MLRFSKYGRCFHPVSHFLMLFFPAGVVEVAIKAEAVTSAISCNNEIVNLPPKGRIDLVRKPLIVKVGFKPKKKIPWILDIILC